MPPRSPSIVVAPAEDRGYHSHISAWGLGGRLRAHIERNVASIAARCHVPQDNPWLSSTRRRSAGCGLTNFPYFFTGTGGLIGRGRSVDRVVSRTNPHRSLEGLR